MFLIICVNVCSLHWITTAYITDRLQEQQGTYKDQFTSQLT